MKRSLCNDWLVCKLEELGHIVTGKTPPTKHTEYYGGRTPFITPSDMDGRKTISTTERYLTDEGVNAVRNSIIPAGAVFVSCIGSDMGKVSIAGKQSVTNQQINSIIVDPSNDAEYIYYHLSARKDEFQRLATSGSAQPILNKGDFSKLDITLPPLPEQRAIAAILGVLDDKIELNRQMNQTLEAMAQALFKSWFVDFEPVHTKAERLSTGLPYEIDHFFPDSFDDSELGEIPRGWKVVSIKDIAERVGMGPFGSSIKVSTFVQDGIPIISGQHLNHTLLEDNHYNFITPAHADKLRNSNVFRGDIIFTHAGNIGQVAYIPETSRYERYVISQRQFYMRCDLTSISPLFVVYFFKTRQGQHSLLANTSSTGVPSISQPVSYLKTIKLPVPAKPLIDAFNEVIRQLHLQMSNNIVNSKTIAAIRDTLLPKLLSGEIRVKDAEKFVEVKI